VRLLRRAWLLPVFFYRRFVSPLMQPSCRFVPSCSEYMVEAVMKKGIIRGTAMGLWRILRCNPLCKGGYDPVERQK